MAQNYLHHPIHVQIGDLGSAKKEILQNVEFLPGGENQKRKVLEKLLSKHKAPPIMIFVNQKVDTEHL